MPVFDVNEATRTSTLKLYSGGAPLTQFSYAAGAVTLAARPNPVTLSLADLALQLDTIGQWVGMVNDRLSPVLTPLTDYKSEIKKKENGTIVGTHNADDAELTRVKCEANSGEATFEPRPEYTMPYADFLRWICFLKQFYRDCVGG